MEESKKTNRLSAVSCLLRAWARRSSRFSLRLMLFGFLVCGLVLGWLGTEYRAANEEQRIATRIVKSGGLVQYDLNRPYSAYHKEAGLFRSWLRSLFGNSLFGRIKFVMIESKVDSRDIRDIKALSQLQVLGFDRSTVTADILQEVKNLPSLEGIFFFRCNFGGKPYDQLGNLEHVQSLWLVPPRREQIPLAFLYHLSELRSLSVDFAVVNIADIACVPLTRNLERLQLMETKIMGNPGQLAELKQLRELVMYCEGLSNDELSFLEEMKKLKSLTLGSISCDEKLLEILGRCKNLDTLIFVHKTLSDTELESMRASLPDCNISQGI